MSQAATRQPIPVGKYFLDRGKITQKQLDLALQHRAEFGLKLGQSLVELGFVNEADMVEALKHQARFPCVHLTRGIVDARAAQKLGEEGSRRLRAIALNQIAGHITVALEDPSDATALEELERILGSRIYPVYAEPSAILAQLEQVFGTAQAPAAKSAEAPAAPARPGTSAKVEPAPANEEAPAERAVVEHVRAFLQHAFEQSASDIHLEPSHDALCVRFRIDGTLRLHTRLSAAWTRPTLACLRALAKLDQNESGVAREGTIPFLFKKRHLAVRVSILPVLRGESAVLHVLGHEPSRRTLAELGLAPGSLAQLQRALDDPRGLVLVSGPAVSGRTTTLHALLARLAGPEKKCVALEERVEHELEHVLHVVHDAAGGGSFAEHARALLHQDPDVLLLGEIDGRETAECVLEVAHEGALALASLRTNGALAAVAHLTRLGLDPYLLAESLSAVVAQRLVRRVCPECKTPSVADEMLRARLDLGKDGTTWYEGEGCSACHGTGFQGRVGVFEVLAWTPALRRALAKGEALEALAASEGFVPLREHALQQARAGLTSLHEVLVATARG
ncbi:MAG: type II/IV secretion system protein [Planctomycetes bacterium]|nr:type II/IV secretion system protein [Planctomycetota bacterium]